MDDKIFIFVFFLVNLFEEYEYCIDWFYDWVEWYVDVVKVVEIDQNIFWKVGVFVVNNWFNGDRYWLVGFFVQDVVFKVKLIDMYFNIFD